MTETTTPLTERMIVKSPTEILTILIIEARENVFNALEFYWEQYYATKGSSPTHILKARIKRFFDCIRAMLKRDFEKDKIKIDGIDTFDKLRTLVLSQDINHNIRAFYIMDEYLDSKNLIKVDNKSSYAGMGFVAKNQAQKNGS